MTTHQNQQHRSDKPKHKHHVTSSPGDVERVNAIKDEVYKRYLQDAAKHTSSSASSAVPHAGTGGREAKDVKKTKPRPSDMEIQAKKTVQSDKAQDKAQLHAKKIIEKRTVKSQKLREKIDKASGTLTGLHQEMALLNSSPISAN